MKATNYVNTIHKTVKCVKNLKALGILDTPKELKIQFHARIDVITDLAIDDPEISPYDFILINNAIDKAHEDVSSLIYEKR